MEDETIKFAPLDFLKDEDLIKSIVRNYRGFFNLIEGCKDSLDWLSIISKSIFAYTWSMGENQKGIVVVNKLYKEIGVKKTANGNLKVKYTAESYVLPNNKRVWAEFQPLLAESVELTLNELKADEDKEVEVDIVEVQKKGGISGNSNEKLYDSSKTTSVNGNESAEHGDDHSPANIEGSSDNNSTIIGADKLVGSSK